MSRWPILAGARRVQVKYDGSPTGAGLDEGPVVKRTKACVARGSDNKYYEQ